MKKHNGENAQTNDAAGCAVAERAEAHEQSFIRNTYRIVCMEPLPEHRARYLKIRENLDRLQAKLARPPLQLLREFYAGHIARAFLDLAAIPKYQTWETTAENLMPTVGKNNMLDNHWSASAYTAAWYGGLINTTAYTGLAAGDTMASHTGWTEDTNYSQATRVAPSFSAAASASKATSAAMVYTMNATTTIKGIFFNSVSTKGGTTGVLTSEVLFSGGDQACTSASTLNVTFTSSLT